MHLADQQVCNASDQPKVKQITSVFETAAYYVHNMILNL